MVSVFDFAKALQFGEAQSNRVGISSIRWIDPPRLPRSHLPRVAFESQWRKRERCSERNRCSFSTDGISHFTVYEFKLNLQVAIERVLD